MSTNRSPEEFLAEANVAVLATVDRRGRPHAAPVWYLYQGGQFLISTDRGSQKHRNIEANPEITLVIDRRTLPYYAVIARGKAEIGPRFTGEERLRLAVRYLGEEMGRAFVASVSGEETVSVRLSPRKLIEFDGRAGR